jgi:DNA ligase-1
MTNKFKPLLACEVPIDKVVFPMYASVKLDGILAIVLDGVLVSRTLKPIRNKYLQQKFGKPEYNFFVGELVCGDIYAEDVFQKSTSAVMSIEGEPKDVKFYIFDYCKNKDDPFIVRIEDLITKCIDIDSDDLHVIRQKLIYNKDEFNTFFEAEFKKNGEGIILRKPDGVYKYGRSTPKQMLSCKYKFMEQDEFIITGFVEQQTNTNEAVINELGYTERSSSKEGMVGNNTLGAFIVQSLCGSITFTVGTGRGLTKELRKEIWDNKESYLGKYASIRYMKAGVVDKPRQPILVGIRDENDL